MSGADVVVVVVFVATLGISLFLLAWIRLKWRLRRQKEKDVSLDLIAGATSGECLGEVRFMKARYGKDYIIQQRWVTKEVRRTGSGDPVISSKYEWRDVPIVENDNEAAER